MPDTALVTGASSGIGEQFARALARQGNDLVLVARRRERLEELAQELPVQSHVVACDLATEADQLGGRAAELGVDVDLLVCNAGFGNYGPFLDQEPQSDASIVRVNCEAVVTLAHAFLPAMVERGRGGVIVVASTAGMQPIPYESVYAASKAFALSFTEALHTELRGTGVRVLAVNPGPVSTEWQAIAGYGESGGGFPLGKVEPEQVVAEALAAYERNRRSVVPGRMMRMVVRSTRFSPRAAQLRLTERIYRPK
ncbi:MAG: SDR family NAD(P)-dependent oxidoreductase [Solirubrobacterales bacterium]